MLDRLLSGIPGLDNLLGGGFPKGTVTLVYGPVGAGKSILARQFLLQGVLEGSPSVLVATASTPDFEREQFASLNWESHLLDRFTILWATPSRPPGVELYALPSNYTEFSIEFSRILEHIRPDVKEAPRLAVDSLTDLLLAGEEEDRRKLLSVLRQKLASLPGLTALFTLEEGPHDASVVSYIETLTDNTITLKMDGERLIMAKRTKFTPARLTWIPFEILNGLELKAMQFFR